MISIACAPHKFRYVSLDEVIDQNDMFMGRQLVYTSRLEIATTSRSCFTPIYMHEFRFVYCVIKLIVQP